MGKDPLAFRSSKASAVDPERASRLILEVGGIVHDLSRSGPAAPWMILKPVPGRADAKTVAALLARLANLEATQVLDPGKAGDVGLEQPGARLRAWEESSASEGHPMTDPTLDLILGRLDRATKTYFAKESADPAVLAFPDALAEFLPRGPLDLLDRTVLAVGVQRINAIAREEGGRRVAIRATGPSGDFTRWEMSSPVRAPADPENVARLAVLIGGLRADRLIGEADDEDARSYGLTDPALRLAWSAAGPGQSSGALILGGPVLTAAARVTRGSMGSRWSSP